MKPIERIEECTALLYNIGGVVDSLSNIPNAYEMPMYVQGQIYGLSKAVELMVKETWEVIETLYEGEELQ